jgi:hypothetical protein
MTEDSKERYRIITRTDDGENRQRAEPSSTNGQFFSEEEKQQGVCGISAEWHQHDFHRVPESLALFLKQAVDGWE